MLAQSVTGSTEFGRRYDSSVALLIALFIAFSTGIILLILKKAVFRYLKKFPYASLPNMYANEEIFPELFKVIRTDEITEKIVEIFENGTDKKIAGKLDRFKPGSDPADLIIKEVFEKDPA